MPSSVIAQIKYYPESSTLRIVFVSGMIFDYKNVPEEVYYKMRTSGSKGAYLNQNIKGHFEFMKVK